MEHSPFWAAAALAEFVRDQASWRRTQAARFPDDARNAQSADALEQLAMHLEALPDADRHLIELIELDAFDDADHFIADEEARRAIARWGFGDATSHMRPRDLLQDLVAITRRARRKPAQGDRTKVTTTTKPTAPEVPTVMWVATRLTDRIMWHAVKLADGGRQLTHCGKNLEAGGAVKELPADEVPVPGCAFCTATVRATAPATEEVPAIPERPLVLWLKEQLGYPMKHAAKTQLEGNLVRTYCGEVLDFPAPAAGEIRFPSLYAGSCPICELELKRADAPLARPGKDQLSDTERDVMYDLLTLAHATDPECQVREQMLKDAIAANPTNFSDELGAYVRVVTELHAAIAPAALARLPILAPLARNDGALIELLERERARDLERFLAPIFMDAGLRDPFALQRGQGSNVTQTTRAVNEAEASMKRFFAEPRDAELRDAALEAILRIPTPAGTRVDWDATKQIIRRTVLAAADSPGSTLEQQGESHSVFVLLREELQRIANEN